MLYVFEFWFFYFFLNFYLWNTTDNSLITPILKLFVTEFQSPLVLHDLL